MAQYAMRRLVKGGPVIVTAAYADPMVQGYREVELGRFRTEQQAEAFLRRKRPNLKEIKAPRKRWA